MGYDSHPLNPIDRSKNRPPSADGQGSIEIGDYAWLGNNVLVLKNVRIGRGAVVAAYSVVTEDVTELAVVAGSPARVVKKIGDVEFPETP